MKMKTRLLKLALCAMAALPIGAWGQTSWNFTIWSESTQTALNGDNTNWKYYSATSPTTGGYWDYIVATAATSGGQAIQAGGNAIAELNGLTFYWPAASGGGRIRIDNRSSNKAVYFKSTQERVFVPNLIAGKKVSINYRASGSNNIQVHTLNANVIPYKQAEASTAVKTDVFIVSSKVTSETSVGFYADNAVNIFSIDVTDATQDEMNYANAKTMFGSDEVITATSLWTFNQYKAGDAISDGSYSEIYLKGHETSTNKSVAGKFDTTSTFGDYTISTSKYLDVKGGYKDITYSTIQTRLASSTIQDCVSLNIGVAGKLYITASLGAASRSIKVFKGNTGDITASSTILIENHPVSAANTPETFNVDITQAGTYWITGANGNNGSGYRIYAMMFVPSTDKDIAMTKTVNISSAGYATFSATQNYDLPDGLEAYIVSGVNETTATMTQVNEIPACTGVILKGAAGEYTLTSKETTSVDVSSNMLKANIADYALPANDGTNYNYILVANGASAVFAHTSGTGDLAANKAFLRTTTNVTSSAAPGFTLNIGTGTTGITEIEKSVNAGNEAVFNLNGQRVAQPKKGLYIVNGKKVIIK